MPATLHDVAEAAGVSIAMVSRGHNNSSHPVNAATRTRILDAAQTLGLAGKGEPSVEAKTRGNLIVQKSSGRK